MRKLKLVCAEGCDVNFYGSSTFHMSFCSTIKKWETDVVQLLTSPATCRESFCVSLWDQITRNTRYNIPLDRTRIIASVGDKDNPYASSVAKRYIKNFNEYMQTVVRLMNIIEAHYGWARTRIYMIDASSVNKHMKAVMISGSNKWMRSSHMLSLYTLLIRSMYENCPHFKNLRSFKPIIETLDTKCKRGNAKFIREAVSNLDVLMGHFDQLFKGLPLRRNFDKAHTNTMRNVGWSDQPQLAEHYFDEGVAKLVRGKSRDSEIKKRFREIKASIRKKG